MTEEQRLREELKERDALLDELVAYFRFNTDGDNIDPEELESINNSIDDYQTNIEKLRAKLNNKNFYKREKIDLEFDLGMQGSSFVDTLQNERENILTANNRYHKRQSELTKLSVKYNTKIKKIKEEIDDISRILKRDELAKSKNIVKKSFLSEEEIIALVDEIEYRQSLSSSLSYLVDYCADEIRRYGKLITICEEHLREIENVNVMVKQIIEQEIKFPEKDIYSYILDKEELRKVENAYNALLNKRNTMTYNPVEAIESVRNKRKSSDEQNSKELDSDKKVIESKEKTISEAELEKTIDDLLVSYRKEKEDLVNEKTLETEVDNNANLEENLESNEVEKSDVTKENIEEPSQKEVETEIQKEVVEPKQKAETVPTFTKESLDNVEPAPEHLKKEKNSDEFKEKWSNWAKAEQKEIAEDFIKKNFLADEAINQDEEQLHEVILTSVGDYVGVPLPNGEMGYINYGDSVENAPEGVNIRYEESKMYITYPERRKTR